MDTNETPRCGVELPEAISVFVPGMDTEYVLNVVGLSNESVEHLIFHGVKQLLGDVGSARDKSGAKYGPEKYAELTQAKLDEINSNKWRTGRRGGRRGDEVGREIASVAMVAWRGQGTATKVIAGYLETHGPVVALMGARVRAVAPAMADEALWAKAAELAELHREREIEAAQTRIANRARDAAGLDIEITL